MGRYFTGNSFKIRFMSKLVELMDAWLYAKYSHKDLTLDGYLKWLEKKDKKPIRKTNPSTNHYQKIINEKRKAKEDNEFLESLREKHKIDWKKAKKNKVYHTEYSLNIKQHVCDLF